MVLKNSMLWLTFHRKFCGEMAITAWKPLFSKRNVILGFIEFEIPTILKKLRFLAVVAISQNFLWNDN